MTMPYHIHLTLLRENWKNLDGKFYGIRHVARILHHQTIICFCLCRTYLTVSISFRWMDGWIQKLPITVFCPESTEVLQL